MKSMKRAERRANAHKDKSPKRTKRVWCAPDCCCCRPAAGLIYTRVNRRMPARWWEDEKWQDGTMQARRMPIQYLTI